MAYKNAFHVQAESYTATAIALHWLMALGLIANFAFGTYMHELPLSPQKLQYYSWHKWAGITLLGLVTLRLVWRLLVRPPDLLPAPAWQQKVAHGLHALLYVLMFAIPLSGWMMSSASGFPVVLFGVWQLPDLVPKDKSLFEILKDVHEALNTGLLVLVITHVAAALKHHLVDRNGTLRRMLPGAGR
jgi:cytochrome b561